MFSILFVPLFAAADRLWGAAEPSFKGKKAVIALAVGGGGFLIGGWPFLALGALWFAYRSVPFADGSQTPQNAEQRQKAIIRHLLPLPVATFIAIGSGGNPLVMAGVMFAYMVAAYLLAVWYGEALTVAQEAGVGIGRENEFVETARGAAYGAALFVYSLF